MPDPHGHADLTRAAAHGPAFGAAVAAAALIAVAVAVATDQIPAGIS